jgi:nucleoid DNA-binding protein
MMSGFGMFFIKEKGTRRGQNPAKGEDMMMMMAPRWIVTFRCSMRLRHKIDRE